MEIHLICVRFEFRCVLAPIIVPVRVYGVFGHLRHFYAADLLINLIGWQVLCAKHLNCPKTQYWLLARTVQPYPDTHRTIFAPDRPPCIANPSTHVTCTFVSIIVTILMHAYLAQVQVYIHTCLDRKPAILTTPCHTLHPPPPSPWLIICRNLKFGGA